MSANVTFQEVIDEVMLEESEPTYQALVRWQKLYPKWRDSLAEYFAIWALDQTLDKADTPEAPADIDAGIDEDAIVEKTMEYAMDTLARQGRLIPQNSSEPLRPLDRMVLAAIVELQGRAEAVHVSDWVDNMAGKRVSLGAIFSALNRLEGRDLIEYGPAAGSNADAGDGEQYVIMATMAGERALAQVAAASTADFLGDLS